MDVEGLLSPLLEWL